MREMRFRGQRIDKGEWVYGFLYQLPLPTGVGCMILTTDNTHEDNSIEPEYHLAFTLWIDLFLVTPETIGQFTGLTDIDGREIYEGDVLKSQFSKNPYGVVTWHDNGYFFADTSFGEWKHYGNGFFSIGELMDKQLGGERVNLEVIGNIFDNPELLEKE